jgi:hypothetical protein
VYTTPGADLFSRRVNADDGRVVGFHGQQDKIVVRRRITADVDHGVRVLSGSLNTLELPRLVSLWRRRQRIVDLCANFGDIIAQIHTIEQIALKDGTSLLKQCR